MKKKLFFAILLCFGFTIVSCSGDDSPEPTQPVNQVPEEGGTISFKFDGVQKTFTTYTVEPEEIDGETRLTIGAYSDTDPYNEWLEFTVNKGKLGQGRIMSVVYYDLEGELYLYTTDVTSNITVNTTNPSFSGDNTLAGSFSAIETGPGENNSITDAIFSFNY